MSSKGSAEGQTYRRSGWSRDGKKPKEIHVVMLALGTQTETVNLSSGETLDNPSQAINLLAAKQLNFRCPGWRVYMIGTNRGRAGKPVGATTDVRLKAWWSAYFARCGGALVTWNNELATFPLGPNQTEGADNRRIPVAITRTRKEIEATVGGDLPFTTGNARLRKGAERGLNRLLPLLGDARGPIGVTGHTDNTGTDEINSRLSRQRADTVAAWMQERSGLPAERFRVRGLGSHDPVGSNNTDAGRAKNRRVVLTIHLDKDS